MAMLEMTRRRRSLSSNNMDVDTRLGEPSRLSKPHDFLWFPDGNVVLATDAYMFKVYKGLLSLHSSVFRDMFKLTSVDESIAGQCGSGTTQEMYEGSPLVRLVGDEGEDVAHLLRTIFDHECVFLLISRHSFF